MDAAIISLLATMIALMFGGFWLLWRTIHKDTTDIRKDITALAKDHARLEGTLETLLKLLPTATKRRAQPTPNPSQVCCIVKERERRLRR